MVRKRFPLLFRTKMLLRTITAGRLAIHHCRFGTHLMGNRALQYMYSNIPTVNYNCEGKINAFKR